ncbi:MAG TPA: hypothetical protein VHW23_19375 [Kofleriaceae bacterium]|nr:hypothetical protein [Kofleriaceae bacterium]
MTPIEVDSLVQGALAEPVVPADVSTRPTVEAVRLAHGSSSLRTALAIPRIKPPVAPATPPVTSSATPIAAPTARPVASAESPSERGTRRTRQTLRVDAICPPIRKR